MKLKMIIEGIILMSCLVIVVLSEFIYCPAWVTRLTYLTILIIPIVNLCYHWWQRKKEEKKNDM